MKPTCRLLVSAVALLAALGVVDVRLSAEVKVVEQVVGPAKAGGVYTVSPHGAHVAYAATKGSRLVVTIDGIEGPMFDELFAPQGQSFFSPQQVSVMPASTGGQNPSTVTPVIYSADGLHYAYAGRQGTEYVIIHDGREIARGPRQMLSLQYGPLALSPTGKHVYWDEMQMQAARASWRLAMDGKPGPWSGHQAMTPVFSPDDSRFAYTMVSTTDQNKRFLMVDGKDAGYFGMQPVFTTDNKLLITIATAPKTSVQINGNPVLNGIQISKVVTAPVGSRYAALVRTKVVGGVGVDTLFLDGKEVPGTDGAQNVWFSPDGKRYAVACVNAAARSAFMVVDGKKGTEYQGIFSEKAPYWTPDGSKLIYTAMSGGRNFLIAEGQEFAITALEGLMRAPIQMAEQGNRFAFATRDGANRNFTVIVDGKLVLPPSLAPVDDSLTFSADGSRYAYLVGPVGRGEITGLVLDGKLVEGLTPVGFAKFLAMELPTTAYLFSRDGKNIAQVARGADPKTSGLYVNGKLVYSTQRGVSVPAFTPDSQHLFWTASEVFPGRPQPYLVVYVDGQPSVRFSENDFLSTKGSWEMGNDGVLTFLAVVDNVVKRYRITASLDTNIAKVTTNAAAAQTKAVADAGVAQKKAEADAAAAKAKGEADATAAAAKQKADAGAATAARQKANADAVAAKAKARQDALDARRKAREEALAAAASAKAKK